MLMGIIENSGGLSIPSGIRSPLGSWYYDREWKSSICIGFLNVTAGLLICIGIIHRLLSPTLNRVEDVQKSVSGRFKLRMVMSSDNSPADIEGPKTELNIGSLSLIERILFNYEKILEGRSLDKSGEDESDSLTILAEGKLNKGEDILFKLLKSTDDTLSFELRYRENLKGKWEESSVTHGHLEFIRHGFSYLRELARDSGSEREYDIAKMREFIASSARILLELRSRYDESSKESSSNESSMNPKDNVSIVEDEDRELESVHSLEVSDREMDKDLGRQDIEDHSGEIHDQMSDKRELSQLIRHKASFTLHEDYETIFEISDSDLSNLERAMGDYRKDNKNALLELREVNKPEVEVLLRYTGGGADRDLNLAVEHLDLIRELYLRSESGMAIMSGDDEDSIDVLRLIRLMRDNLSSLIYDRSRSSDLEIDTRSRENREVNTNDPRISTESSREDVTSLDDKRDTDTEYLSNDESDPNLIPDDNGDSNSESRDGDSLDEVIWMAQNCSIGGISTLMIDTPLNDDSSKSQLNSDHDQYPSLGEENHRSAIKEEDLSSVEEPEKKDYPSPLELENIDLMEEVE